jgi:hypothetical protein
LLQLLFLLFLLFLLDSLLLLLDLVREYANGILIDRSDDLSKPIAKQDRIVLNLQHNKLVKTARIE